MIIAAAALLFVFAVLAFSALDFGDMDKESRRREAFWAKYEDKDNK